MTDVLVLGNRAAPFNPVSYFEETTGLQYTQKIGDMLGKNVAAHESKRNRLIGELENKLNAIIDYDQTKNISTTWGEETFDTRLQSTDAETDPRTAEIKSMIQCLRSGQHYDEIFKQAVGEYMQQKQRRTLIKKMALKYSWVPAAALGAALAVTGITYGINDIIKNNNAKKLEWMVKMFTVEAAEETLDSYIQSNLLKPQDIPRFKELLQKKIWNINADEASRLIPGLDYIPAEKLLNDYIQSHALKQEDITQLREKLKTEHSDEAFMKLLNAEKIQDRMRNCEMYLLINPDGKFKTVAVQNYLSDNFSLLLADMEEPLWYANSYFDTLKQLQSINAKLKEYSKSGINLRNVINLEQTLAKIQKGIPHQTIRVENCLDVDVGDKVIYEDWGDTEDINRDGYEVYLNTQLKEGEIGTVKEKVVVRNNTETLFYVHFKDKKYKNFGMMSRGDDTLGFFWYDLRLVPTEKHMNTLKKEVEQMKQLFKAYQ
jgi:hypothetical protein